MTERRRELPYYECVRCEERTESEPEILTHLKEEHKGEGDGKMDYAVNLPPTYLEDNPEENHD